MPQFKFRVDTSTDYASSIDRLLSDPKVARDLDHDEGET
jgi:ribosome-binding factor A